MKPLGDLRKHYMLARTMADRLGVDVAEAAEDGRLSLEDWSEAVTRCRGCEAPGACADWERDTAPGEADEAPGYCRNAQLFEALRP